MKKSRIGFVSLMMAILLVCGACGLKTGEKSPMKETLPKTSVKNNFKDSEEVLITLEQETKDTITAISDEYKSVKETVPDYETYLSAPEKITDYYTFIDQKMNQLYDHASIYYEDYFRIAFDRYHSDKDALEAAIDEFYNRICEGVFEDLYDNSYDKTFDDVYDDICDDLFDDAYRTAEYSEWAKANSQCYKDWSDASASVYRTWSDEYTKCYTWWSVMQGCLYNGDRDFDALVEAVKIKLTERAEERERISNYVDFTTEFEIINGKAYVVGYSGSGNHITIPSEYENCDVVGIKTSAFEGCTELQALTIWAEIEKIGDAAFKDCTSLIEFSVPNTVTVIGNHAFENCENLESLIIWGDSDIGAYSFANCKKLKAQSISSNTKKICDHAFDGCSNLESVILWGKDTEIGVDAFANCPKLSNPPRESGYSVYLEPAVQGGVENVSVSSESTDETATVQNGETDESSEDSPSEDLIDGMRPEFKEAMDSYEAFYDEYCEILKKYEDEPTDLTILSDYASFMSKAIEMDKDFEKWDGDLNDAETKYYLEVHSRILQKLADVS